MNAVGVANDVGETPGGAGFGESTVVDLAGSADALLARADVVAQSAAASTDP